MKCKLISGTILTLVLVGILMLAFDIQIVRSDLWDGVINDPHPAQATWVDPVYTVNLNESDTFIVDIIVNITDPPGQEVGMYGFEYKFAWDDTVLSLTSYDPHCDNAPPGDLPAGWASSFVAKDDTSVSGVHWYGVSCMSGPGFTGVASLCTYTFQYHGHPGVGLSVLDIQYNKMDDGTASPLPSTISDGYAGPPATVNNIDTSLSYITIQNAIDAPETLDGHTIKVDTLTYYEHVTINKLISLVGENRSATIDGSGIGSVLRVTASQVTVKNLTIQNGYHALSLHYSNDSVISENTIQNAMGGMYSCISLNHSNRNRIEKNNIAEGHNIYGILLTNSSHNLIIGNSIENSENGTFLQGSCNNSITQNKMTDGWNGICLLNSSGNIISENNIIRNGGTSIQLDGASNNTITKNTIRANNQQFTYPLRVEQSVNNLVYHNNFINSTNRYIEASVNTTWDNGYEGNYWSNYNGSDLDSPPDGVGDEYLPWKGVDYFPLMNPYLEGDSNHDGIVDIVDGVIIAIAFGTEPNNPKWNPHSDLNEDKTIDIVDIVIWAIHFGETW